MNLTYLKTFKMAVAYFNCWPIRKYLSGRSTEALIQVFISSLLDYCNSLLYGLPAYTGRKNGLNDICLQDKSKTNLMSDLSTQEISQM